MIFAVGLLIAATSSHSSENRCKKMDLPTYIEHTKRRLQQELDLEAEAERARQQQENADRIDLLNTILMVKLSEEFRGIVAKIYEIKHDPKIPASVKKEQLRLLTVVKDGIEKQVQDRAK
jgi:alpha-acetolactate decarboxylase